MPTERPTGATLHVCTTCRGSEEVGPDGTRPGARLYEALAAGEIPEGLRVVPVECLSACNTGCAVALSAPGRWSYVYGQMTLDDAPEILTGATAYAATTDGIVPWRARVTIFRKRSLARIPPILLEA